MKNDNEIKFSFEDCIKKKISLLEKKHKKHLKSNNINFDDTSPYIITFDFEINGKIAASRSYDYGEEINKEIEDILNECAKEFNL